MDIEQLRIFCLGKKATTESLPFGPDTLVFKVADKVFALCSINDYQFINLKCDPEKALELREEHPQYITPAYHMNKKHWNSVSIQMPTQTIIQLINHSYDLVVKSLPKHKQLALENEV
jgi:predicted DNA-binding protein (MmcQ/YjbR family)